jgi:GxxExxY protein
MSSISFTLLKQLATDVYTKIGPWASESIYQNALKYALINAGFAVESERDLPVEYEGLYVGTVRADLVVAKQLVLELKAVAGASKSTLDTAVMQCKHYLRLTGIPRGAVVIFPQRTGQEVCCREVTLSDPESEASEADESEAAAHVARAPNPFDDDHPTPAEFKKGRKKGPMTDEAKARMRAKRAATLAAKAAKAAAV